MAKKKTETTDANAPKPAKKGGKKSSQPATTGQTAGVDTDAAARLAALMVGKKMPLPSASGSGSGKSSAMMQQLKQGGGLPSNLGGGASATFGQKKNVGHTHNQLGRNQVGGHINPNVPRRTPG